MKEYIATFVRMYKGFIGYETTRTIKARNLMSAVKQGKEIAARHHSGSMVLVKVIEL